MSHQDECTIIIIRRVFLVVTAVACLLLGYYESKSGEWWQQQPTSRETVIFAATSEQTCRALFTITAIHQTYSFSEVTTHNSLSNGTYSRGLSSEEWRVNDSAKVANSVHHLLRKRSSLSGALTTDYYSLAALLPKVLSFGEKTNDTRYDKDRDTIQEKRKEKSNKLTPPFFLGKSRVTVGDGVLPHVPCTVAPYDDPGGFPTCVKRRLERAPRFWLCFMGDSKIRNLFSELLNRTDSEFQYTVHVMNAKMSWPETKNLLLKTAVWTDMEATTQAAPRMSLTYRFRRFSEMKPKMLNSTTELVELKKWASGFEPTPDLLVVGELPFQLLLVLGYTSWMMQWREVWNEAENHYPPDILDFLMQMHRAVVPLLEQISQRTRLLVVPQSRLRPHSNSSPNVMAAFNPTNFDWGEMTFGFLLRRYRASQAPRHLPWNNQEESNKSGTYEVSYGAKEQTMVHAATARDHLVPSRSTSGLWWWDSSLLLNLASILECDELYRRGLASHSAFRSRLLYCLDSQHAGTITNNDMVTMLFNLICNSHLDLHHSYCCT